ncbi:MAG: hypothetical protein R2769_08330 [Saprospiraceae bacterium]
MEGKAISKFKCRASEQLGLLKVIKKSHWPFFEFESFTQPLSIYQLDLSSNAVSIWKKPNLDFDSDKYETDKFGIKQDGTNIPMFIVHKKGLKLDGTAPTLYCMVTVDLILAFYRVSMLIAQA